MCLQIKTPSFFYKKSFVWILLYPVALLAAVLGGLVFLCRRRRRVFKKPKSICVSSFLAKGGGKTLTCIAMAKHLIGKGHRCCFLTLGYGRNNAHKHFVKQGNPGGLLAETVGEESLLLADVADVFVVNGRKRVISLVEDYDFVICEDGLWENNVFYDFRVAVVGRRYGLGNGLPLPAGPLRGFFFFGTIFSDWLILIDDCFDTNGATANECGMVGCGCCAKFKFEYYVKHFQKSNRLINAKMKILSTHDASRRYLAFSGLANNQVFFNTLHKGGYDAVICRSFADHHVYTKFDVEKLMDDAVKNSLALITTKKDWLKIADLGLEVRMEVVCVDIEIDGLDKML